MSCKPENVIADNSTLSNFARSGHWHLLLKIFPHGIWTTGDVVLEIERGIEKGYTDLQAVLNEKGRWLFVIDILDELEEKEQKKLHQMYTSIRRGADSSILAVARVRQFTILTDDRAMVRIAQKQELSVIKTSDLLRIAFNRGLISQPEYDQIHEDMRMKSRFIIW